MKKLCVTFTGTYKSRGQKVWFWFLLQSRPVGVSNGGGGRRPPGRVCLVTLRPSTETQMQIERVIFFSDIFKQERNLF